MAKERLILPNLAKAGKRDLPEVLGPFFLKRTRPTTPGWREETFRSGQENTKETREWLSLDYYSYF